MQSRDIINILKKTEVIRMQDFSERLKEELSKATKSNGSSNNNDNGPQRKSRPVYVNKKNPFFGRILPLGDKWFAVTTKRVQMTLPKKNGEYTMSPILDMDNKEDKLATLIKQVQHYNYQYRQDHDVPDQYDAIGLNKEPFGGGEPTTRVQTRSEFIGIQMVQGDNGQYVMEQGPNGPIIRNFSASGTVYNDLLELMADKSYTVNGQPFPDALGFVSARETFPVQAKIHGQNQWSVTPRPDIVLPAMTYNYLEKGVNGEDYKYFDDPYLFNQPLMKANPDFYERVYGQVKEIVTKRMEELKSEDSGFQGNPYEQPEPQEPQQWKPQAPVQQTQPQAPKALQTNDYPEPWAQAGEVPANPGKVSTDEYEPQAPEPEQTPKPESAQQAQPQVQQTPEVKGEEIGDGMTADKNVDDLLSELGL